MSDPRTLDFEALFERSPNPYMVVDREMRYVAVNAAYAAATGKTREELLGKRLTDVFPHDPADPNNESKRRLEASIARVLESGEADALPFIHYRIAVRRAGVEQMEDRYWSATHTPLLGRGGRVEHVLQHTVDVTALRSTSDEAGVLARAERLQERTEGLDKMNAWLRRMFARAPFALAVLDGPRHTVALANARICEMWGRTEDQMLGRPLFDAMPEIRGQGLEELLGGVLERGEPHVGNEMPVAIARGPGGALETAYFDFVYQPFDEGGVLVVAAEVTGAVVARRKTEAAQAELEAIFESFPEALFVGDATGMKRANEPARALLGFETQDQLLRGQPELVRDIDARSYETGLPVAPEDAPFGRALRGETTRMLVTFRHWRTGERRTLFSSGAPIRTGGTLTGAVVTQIDVTDQKNAELEARKLARVLDETRDFVGIADLSGRPTFVNHAGLALMGLDDMESACAVPMLEYFVPDERERVAREVIPAAIANGYWEGELAFEHRKTGEHIPVLYAIFPLRDAHGNITALATITRDLRAQKAAEAERAQLLANERAARAQAEEASLVKDEFLAVVSHELRTPLTAILGWLQMLRSGMVPVEGRTRALDTIERNARVQAQLVDDLLDVGRIMSGKLAFDMIETPIASVVAAAAETVRPAATAKGISLVVAIDPGHRVLGDAHRLQQVVWNLLTNAVKFTPKGGSIHLISDRVGSEVEILVSDTGAGIAPEFLPHVFERFRQADGGTQRALGGLGLGLSIVQHVVTAHGGTVHAESAGLGRGATFRVRLPRLDASLPPLRHAAGEEESGRSLDGLHVLVVDDEDDARELVGALLKRAKARVTIASSASEALAVLERERPDLVVSDIAMPHEDGYSLVRRLRASKDARLATTPAIALTAHARSEDRTRALRAGFQNHVTKPIDSGELLAVIASVTKRDGR